MKALNKLNIVRFFSFFLVLFCLISVVKLKAYSQTEKQKAIDFHIEQLKSNDRKEVDSAAIGLRILGKNNRKAIDALIDVVKNNKTGSYYAADVLKEIAEKDRYTIDSLLPLFKVNISVHGILRKIAVNDETAIFAILNYINDEAPQVRKNAILLVGEISPNNQYITEKLIEIISQDDKALEDGRWAAFALKEITKYDFDSQNSSKAFASQKLIRIIETTKNIDVLKNAIFALNSTAKPKHNKIAETLIKLINENNDNAILRMAADTLGNISSGQKHVIQSITIAIKKEKNHPSEWDWFFYNLFEERPYSKILVEQSNKLIDAKDTSSNEELHIAFEELITVGDEKIPWKANDELRQLGRNIERLDEIKKLGELEIKPPSTVIKTFIAENKSIIILLSILVLLFLTWLLVFRFRPIWLFQINELLEPLTSLKLPEWLGGYTIPFRYALLVGFFHYHPQVLDAWVEKYVETAKERFNNLRTVGERKDFISLPILINGKSKTLNVGELQQFYRGNQSYLLICGEGGSGKTSLACELGKWAINKEKSARLCTSHKMLPIIIEQEVEKDKLVTVIEAHLRGIINEQNLLSSSLVIELLKKRRILVIIDGFSEMKGKDHLLEGIKSVPLNSVIFTSRFNEDMNNLQTDVIQTKRVYSGEIYNFIEKYFEKLEKGSLFTGVEIHAGCAELLKLAKNNDITALLAKLFADHMIYSKETEGKEFIPKNIPYLMLDYIKTLKYSPIEEYPEPPDELLFRDAIQKIAWKCLEQDYRPGQVDLRDVIEFLGNNGGKILKHADKGLNLITIEHRKLRFSLDPLSEYLAGFYLVDEYKGDEKLWRNFIDSIDKKDGSPDSIRGFLQAVHDCCSTDTATKVPKFVIEELNKKMSETV